MPIEKIARVITADRTVNQLQENIIRSVGPVTSNLIVDGIVLPEVALTFGTNSVNHLLGRNLIGWVVTRMRSPAIIYDTQDDNLMPNLTLALNASAATIVDLYVF